jgi:hypothetical protein
MTVGGFSHIGMQRAPRPLGHPDAGERLSHCHPDAGEGLSHCHPTPAQDSRIVIPTPAQDSRIVILSQAQRRGRISNRGLPPSSCRQPPSDRSGACHALFVIPTPAKDCRIVIPTPAKDSRIVILTQA